MFRKMGNEGIFNERWMYFIQQLSLEQNTPVEEDESEN